MRRVDLYGSVHKAQRARLFALVVEAGRTDPEDEPAAAAVAAMAAAVAGELHEHGEHEDQFIHPLLERYAPQLAAGLAAEHRELDGALAALTDAAALREPAGAASLYRVASRFTATYLAHLEREEGEAMPVLWDNATQEELAAVLTAFRGSRSQLQNTVSLLGQLPTLTPREAAAMVAVAFDAATLQDIRDLLTGLLAGRQLRALPELWASPRPSHAS
jgi:hypothetical protein